MTPRVQVTFPSGEVALIVSREAADRIARRLPYLWDQDEPEDEIERELYELRKLLEDR